MIIYSSERLVEQEDHQDLNKNKWFLMSFKSMSDGDADVLTVNQ